MTARRLVVVELRLGPLKQLWSNMLLFAIVICGRWWRGWGVEVGFSEGCRRQFKVFYCQVPSRHFRTRRTNWKLTKEFPNNKFTGWQTMRRMWMCRYGFFVACSSSLFAKKLKEKSQVRWRRFLICQKCPSSTA